MENLTGGTPPVRYLPCVVPCKLYFGDAFTNLIVPTSGCLIGSLAIAKIEWSNWIKFMWKFLGVLMIGAIITVLVAVGIGF